MKHVYIFLAEGFEPLEALAPMDVLKRAKQNVKFVSISSSRSVMSAQGYPLEADLVWDEFLSERLREPWDTRNCLVFPGGLPGADNLGSFTPLTDLLREHFDQGGLVGAICAAPARVLAPNIDVRGRRMTAYEGFEDELASFEAVPTGEDVTEDGNIITAKGPGLAIDFGLALLYRIVDPRIADVVKKAMMI